MLARARGRSTEAPPQRIVDPHRHFLGLIKDGAIYIYCRGCKQFLRLFQRTNNPTASRPPMTGSDCGVEAWCEREAETPSPVARQRGTVG